MGAITNARNCGQIKTSELANWISKIKFKKLNNKTRRRKNLFMDAVLSNALTRAEYELRRKQQERRLRWQTYKSRWTAIDHNYNRDCNDDDDDENSPKIICDDNPLYEELNALDNFMLKLKGVKVPIQR